jgi:hypothetical protein
MLGYSSNAVDAVFGLDLNQQIVLVFDFLSPSLVQRRIPEGKAGRPQLSGFGIFELVATGMSRPMLKM